MLFNFLNKEKQMVEKAKNQVESDKGDEIAMIKATNAIILKEIERLTALKVINHGHNTNN